MGGLVLFLIALAAVIFGVVYLYKTLLWIGFNASAFIDNMLRVDGRISPLVAWGILGAFVGAAAGVWVASSRYRFGRFKPLVLGALFFVAVSMILITKPGQFRGEHPYITASQTAQERAAIERRQWEAEHARYVIANGGVNIRTQPTVNGGRITTLERGAVVYFLNQNGDWVRVEFRTGSGALINGWVRGDLIGSRDALGRR